VNDDAVDSTCDDVGLGFATQAPQEQEQEQEQEQGQKPSPQL
jgi:hypothetical protein